MWSFELGFFYFMFPKFYPCGGMCQYAILCMAESYSMVWTHGCSPVFAVIVPGPPRTPKFMGAQVLVYNNHSVCI